MSWFRVTGLDFVLILIMDQTMLDGWMIHMDLWYISCTIWCKLNIFPGYEIETMTFSVCDPHMFMCVSLCCGERKGSAAGRLHTVRTHPEKNPKNCWHRSLCRDSGVCWEGVCDDSNHRQKRWWWRWWWCLWGETEAGVSHAWMPRARCNKMEWKSVSWRCLSQNTLLLWWFWLKDWLLLRSVFVYENKLFLT